MRLDKADWFVDQLKCYADPSDLGRMRADLIDLMEISQWFLNAMEGSGKHNMTQDELETFLIELEVQLTYHANFHLQSLKKNLRKMLRRFPDE